MRFTVIITDFIFFFVVLYLFRTFTSANKSTKFSVSPTVLTFCICFLDAGLLAIDNGNPQYNSFIFSIVILSVVLMYKKRVLLSALVYSLSILTKHITFFYSFGYVALLLFTYCLTFKPFRINLSNSVKLGTVVLASIVIVFFPFRHKLNEVKYYLFGGTNWPQGTVPNLLFVITMLSQPFIQYYNQINFVPR